MAMGFVLLALGIASLVAGGVFFLRMKRMESAPFRSTGEIARDPGVVDPRGMISTEGEIVSDAPALGPCSGKACLYYDVRVERHWDKTIPSPAASSNKTATGRTEILARKGGILFELDDGSGPVSVDARSRERVDCDLTPSHDQRIPIGTNPPIELVFGHLRVATPDHDGTDRTVAFTAVERILPAAGTLYVCGKLANGAISRPGWTPLLLSSRGRRAFMGGTRTKAWLGLVSGAVLTAGSVPASLLGWPSGDTRVQPSTLPDSSVSPPPPANSENLPSPPPTAPPAISPAPSIPPPPTFFPPPPMPSRRELTPPKPGPGRKK
jgi:hypothetical protein